MVFFDTLQGDVVWYNPGGDGEFDLPIGGTVKSADAGQVVVNLVTGEEVR